MGGVQPEGSQRLIQAGADVVKQREFSEEEREAKRRIALELNLGQHIGPGNNAPLWTAEELALLGTGSVAQIAAMIGRTQNAVRLKRVELDISNLHDGRKRR